MAEIYVRLTYDAYKAFEKACRDCKETTHTSTGGFTIKAFAYLWAMILGWKSMGHW